MALFQIQFRSTSLARSTQALLLLPNDVTPEEKAGNENYQREMRTLVLLHGYTGSCYDWLTGSRIQELSARYNLAVAMPTGENSFYLDQKGTGHAYGTFVGKELIAYLQETFHIAMRREDTYIGGLSMGGFGALHTGLLYPEHYSRIFALSSALIVHEVMGMKEGRGNEVADYDYYRWVFGEPASLENSENNPEFLVKQRKKRGEQIQPVFMACGTEDFLLENNRQFRDFLTQEGVELHYQESAGIHDWEFWNQYLEPAIRWLLGIG